jgi:predicted nucleic acid-binding protein
MFLRDTNILSAAMSSRPAPEVANWLTQQPADLLFTAAVCQAEILSGITVLHEGRRREALEMAARSALQPPLRSR